MRAPANPPRAGRLAVLLLGPLLMALWGAPARAGEARAGEKRSGWSDQRKKKEALRMYREYRKEFPRVPEVAAADAAVMARDKGAVLVDARAPRERRVSMIPGALSPEAFARRGKALAGKPVVVYCTIGYRSGELARELIKKGVKAHNMIGGVLLWAHADLPLIKPKARGGEATRRLHVYGAAWDLAPALYSTVYP